MTEESLGTRRSQTCPAKHISTQIKFIATNKMLMNGTPVHINKIIAELKRENPKTMTLPDLYGRASLKWGILLENLGFKHDAGNISKV